MEEVIKAWGIPENLKGDYEYKFNGKISAIKERTFGMNRGYTFCLVDKSNGKEVVIIDFFLARTSVSGPVQSVRIEIIYVPHLEYRNKGVATFFVSKIKNYALSIGVNRITVTVAPNARIFKSSNKSKGPTKEELIKFYKSFEDDDFIVSILNNN